VAADVAMEVAEVLESAGHKVLVQDFDIQISANFVMAMHNALTSARHFIGLLTEDYDVSPFTGEEWTAFFALTRPSGGKRRLVILRIEEVAAPGLLASIIYGDLVNVTNREQRRQIILAAAEGRSTGKRRGNQVFHGVPPRNPDFTGRAELLTKLHLSLDAAGKPTAITQAAIHGLGGVGKTSLATEYAHIHTDDYAGVWWAPAENRTILMTSLAELAGVLDSRFASEASTEKATRAALAMLANHERPWLLIYDNVSRPDEIRDLRPSKGASLLIASRHPDWGGQASELEIDVLERADAIDFLMKRAHRADSIGAAELAEALGYLPLALDHAGAYVTSAAISFQEYARRYHELIAKAPGKALSTAATFDLAIERARDSCEHVEKLLGFFAVLAPERIPLSFVDSSIISERDRDGAMMALFSVSLIKSDASLNNERVVSIHRLVRAAMRARLLHTKKLVQTLTSATARLVALLSKQDVTDPRTWPWCEQVLPHALALARDPENRSKFTVFLLQAAGSFLVERGAYAQGEQIVREGLTLANRLFGSRHPAYGVALQTASRPLFSMGKLSEAEALCREAIQIFTRKRGDRDEVLAASLDTLGGIIAQAGRAAEAEPYQVKAIALMRKEKGQRHPVVATLLANFANALMDLDRLSEAEQLHREAISISEKANGRESLPVSRGIGHLANLLRLTNRLGEAEGIAREALANAEKSVGRRHRDFASVTATLALILRDSDRAQEAETLFREATEILLEALGPEHADLGFVRAALARLLATTGRDAEAGDQAAQALAIHANTVASGLLWRRSYALELAAALDTVGRQNDAAEIRSRYPLKQKHESK
jgi:TIR domain/Tetratricopeptide repeat